MVDGLYGYVPGVSGRCVRTKISNDVSEGAGVPDLARMCVRAYESSFRIDPTYRTTRTDFIFFTRLRAKHHGYRSTRSNVRRKRNVPIERGARRVSADRMRFTTVKPPLSAANETLIEKRGDSIPRTTYGGEGGEVIEKSAGLGRIRFLHG